MKRKAVAIVVEKNCIGCTRCIDACPTDALIAPHKLDSNLCISYLTIEKRGAIPEAMRDGLGQHIFGCDICQDVCPWNRRAPATSDEAFAPRHFAPRLDDMAALTEEEFHAMFRGTPVSRAKYEGFMRNVAIARARVTESSR